MRQSFFSSFRKKAGRAFRRCTGLFRRTTAASRSQGENDSEQVVTAARLLQVSEFEFFRLAYSGWYGREIMEKETEQFFARYLLCREIPYWVRHLARRIQELHSRSALDPRELGVDRPPPLREDGSTKVICGLLLGVIYSFLFLSLAGFVSPW
jgi:hypothetical protein